MINIYILGNDSLILKRRMTRYVYQEIRPFVN